MPISCDGAYAGEGLLDCGNPATSRVTSTGTFTINFHGSRDQIGHGGSHFRCNAVQVKCSDYIHAFGLVAHSFTFTRR